jgi:uncharacterized protein YcaQ
MNRRESHAPPASMVSWDQVRAFRLRRHHLDQRGPRNALPAIVGDMGGAQAQVLSAAQLSIWARVKGLGKGDIDAALWRDRTLARAWSMRRTMFLLPSTQLAVFVRGSARRAEKEIRSVLRGGVPETTLDRVLQVALSSLDKPISRTELAERVCKKLGLRMRWESGGGWGSTQKVPCVSLGQRYLSAGYILHLLGARAVVCSGPNKGGEATFVRADAWLPDWSDIGPEQAEDEILRRYLRSFGPATAQDFVAWTEMTLADARRIWGRQASNLAPVSVEGWPAWILRRDVTTLENAVIEQPAVRLLPHFDSYLLGHIGRAHLLEMRHHKRVYRNQGWIAPVVLVEGRVAGVWEQHRDGDRLTVRVEPFGRVSSDVASGIRSEAAELGRFVGCPTVDVAYQRAG